MGTLCQSQPQVASAVWSARTPSEGRGGWPAHTTSRCHRTPRPSPWPTRRTPFDATLLDHTPCLWLPTNTAC
eukprot:4603401-Pyramimonas_sp.AAC.1